MMVQFAETRPAVALLMRDDGTPDRIQFAPKWGTKILVCFSVWLLPFMLARPTLVVPLFGTQPQSLPHSACLSGSGCVSGRQQVWGWWHLLTPPPGFILLLNTAKCKDTNTACEVTNAFTHFHSTTSLSLPLSPLSLSFYLSLSVNRWKWEMWSLDSGFWIGLDLVVFCYLSNNVKSWS